jgi:hypothetical protein
MRYKVLWPPTHRAIYQTTAVLISITCSFYAFIQRTEDSTSRHHVLYRHATSLAYNMFNISTMGKCTLPSSSDTTFLMHLLLVAGKVKVE